MYLFFKICNANAEGLVSSILCSYDLISTSLLCILYSLWVFCAARCVFFASSAPYFFWCLSLIRNLEFEAAATLKMPTSLIARGAGKGTLLPSRQRMEKEYQMAARCRLSSSAYYACSGYERSSDPPLPAVFLEHCFFFQKGKS